MTKYYGPGNSPTESEAMKHLVRDERKRQEPKREKPKRQRVQVWQAGEDPMVSLKRFVDQMEDENGQ